MKKIMFNDKYGLTQAVLEGRKTMTRRIISDDDIHWAKLEHEFLKMTFEEFLIDHAYYLPFEVVAIAQSYKDCGKENLKPRFQGQIFPPYPIYDNLAGWNNKMFVKAELMPHHIRITNIRIERLQDISEDDCIHEGIKEDWSGFIVGNTTYKDIRCAYSALIDKVSGKGTWNRNPWVFVYEFELID